MSRKLNISALTQMEGQEVRVHDLEYDAFDQICLVKLEKVLIKKGKVEKIAIKRLWLENEEFLFEFANNTCSNGKFEVYSLN